MFLRCLGVIVALLITVNVGLAQEIDTGQIVDKFCNGFSQGLHPRQLAPGMELLDQFKVEDAAFGDLFYTGRTDAAAILLDLASDVRFIMIFQRLEGETFLPHGFEFTQIPCGYCDGALGGTFDLTIDRHVLTVPFMAGSAQGTKTTLRYRLNRQRGLFEQIGRDYVRFDRLKGKTTRKESYNYTTGVRIINGRRSNFKVQGVNAFQPAPGCLLKAPDLADKPRWTVFAGSLSLREGPGGGYNRFAKLAFGEPVVVLAAGPQATIGGKHSRWYKLQTGRGSGYAFGAYLLPVPPPPADGMGFQSYLQQLAPAGPPEDITDKTDRVTAKIQSYTHGIRFIERLIPFSGETISEYHLGVKGISLFQGWLLARAIISERTRALPEITDAEILDDAGWQIISVKKDNDGDGVVIFYPERAD